MISSLWFVLETGTRGMLYASDINNHQKVWCCVKRIDEAKVDLINLYFEHVYLQNTRNKLIGVREFSLLRRLTGLSKPSLEKNVRLSDLAI